MNCAGLAEKEAGNQAFREGDTERAIFYYTQAVDSNPNEATYYSNRSAAYHKLGNFQKAIEDSQKCIELRPEWPKGYYRLGEGYFGRELFAKASDAYSKALDLEPSDVGVREALARAEKALYNKVLEEEAGRRQSRETEGVAPSAAPTANPAAARSKLIDYDSDGDDYSYERRDSAGGASSSMSNYTSDAERHKEIMNRRLAQGTGISSIEDYMRYRSAGGTKVEQDRTTALTSTQLPDVKPVLSRAEMLKSLGIEATGPANFGSSTQLSPTNGGPTMSSSYDAEASRKADLAKQRAEFMASINMNGSITGAGGTTDSSWSRIQGSDRQASMQAPSSSGSSARAERRGDDDEAWRPSSVSTVHSDGSARTPPPFGGGPTSEGRTPPLHGRRSGRGSETPPDTPPGSGYAMPRHAPGPFDHQGHRAAPMGQRQAAGEEEEAEVDTRHLAKQAIAGASVAANHPLFAGLKTKAKPGEGGEGGYEDPTSAVPNYKVHKGEGEEVSRNWMQEFRLKKEMGEKVKVQVGDEKVLELKQQYSGFHYRRYKENTGDDDETKKTHLANAITAEALAGYDYNKMF